MARSRTDMHRLQDLVRLFRMGRSAREVTRLLKMGRNVVRAYRDALADAGLLEGDPAALPELEELRAAVEARVGRDGLPPQQTSTVEPWIEVIEEMIGRGAAPKAIFDCLRVRDGEFKPSLSAVKRIYRRLKKAAGVRAIDVVIPVETDPGEVAQVDFGYVGKLYDPDSGVLRKAWIFVMTLGYSRLMWADIVFDQKIVTWIDLHQRAFIALGGVPRVIVPDNLKSAVVRAAFGVDDVCALNRSYRELARHYGFQIDPTPPRSPEKKGKVEAGVRYVRGSFLRPRDLHEIGDARSELVVWLREIANLRVHGTTGRLPQEVFDSEERERLLPLPPSRFEPVIWKRALVHRDSHVLFERKLYSVPWRFIGGEAWIRATDTSVAIYINDERVATHPLLRRGHRSTDDAHLPEHRVDLRYRSRAYWEERADALAPEIGDFIRRVFDQDDVLLNLRPVQSMVRLLAQHPRERAVAACVRAGHFGNYTYQGLKNILRRALDLEPLPAPPAKAATGPSILQPRFARSVAELVFPNLETDHYGCP